MEPKESDINNNTIPNIKDLKMIGDLPLHIYIYRQRPNEPEVMLVDISLETGEVKFSEEYTLEEASESFWTALGQGSPKFLEKVIYTASVLLNQLTKDCPYYYNRWMGCKNIDAFKEGLHCKCSIEDEANCWIKYLKNIAKGDENENGK